MLFSGEKASTPSPPATPRPRTRTSCNWPKPTESGRSTSP
jgi:hypothetical protein